MLRDPIIQNLFPEIFEYSEAIDVIKCLKEWPLDKLSTIKEIAQGTNLTEKEVDKALKTLETTNLVYTLKIHEVCLSLIDFYKKEELTKQEMAKKVKLEIELVDQFFDEDPELLEKTKKKYSKAMLGSFKNKIVESFLDESAELLEETKETCSQEILSSLNDNFIYHLEMGVNSLNLIELLKRGELSNNDMAKHFKLDLECFEEFLKENEDILEKSKEKFTRKGLNTLYDNFIDLDKKSKEKKESAEKNKDKKESTAKSNDKASENKEEAKGSDEKDGDLEGSEDKSINADQENAEDSAVIKKEVDAESEIAEIEENVDSDAKDAEKDEEESDKEKSKKGKGKTTKKTKAVHIKKKNAKLWYLSYDEIINCLKNGFTTDEDISEKIVCKLNIVRKILYKLYDMRLASYKRDKDKETQWYTYDWEFNDKEYKKLEFVLLSEDLKKLNEELEYLENNMFFVCPLGHYRLDFEDASTVEFLCPMCDEELVFEDNQDRINSKKEEIRVIEELMADN